MGTAEPAWGLTAGRSPEEQASSAQPQDEASPRRRLETRIAPPGSGWQGFQAQVTVRTLPAPMLCLRPRAPVRGEGIGAPLGGTCSSVPRVTLAASLRSASTFPEASPFRGHPLSTVPNAPQGGGHPRVQTLRLPGPGQAHSC